MDTIIQYLSLESLAAYLGLPENYLRRMAKAGIIPSLNVSGRLRFDLAAVKEALIDYQRKEGGKREWERWEREERERREREREEREQREQREKEEREKEERKKREREFEREL